jgi:transcription elongation factor SPT5
MKRQADATKDAEELAKELDEKYRRREMARAQKSGAGAIPLALPTINDPSIWGVKCRPGKEKEIILSVMRRLDQRLHARMPTTVYSVFTGSGTAMAGYLYCEADTKQDMLELLDGISNIFLGSPPIPISIQERPDLLRKQKREPLEVGKFVRVLRPVLYKGDLGKIVEVHANGLDASVQLVPRLDYGGPDDSKDQKRKRGFGSTLIRPPPKLFNESEAKKKNMKHLSMHGTGSNRQFTYKGESYINGFLVKEIKVNQLQTENVNPRMDEMQLFGTISADGTEIMDLVAVQAAQKAAQSGSLYVSGENVEIYDGEQKGVRGTTVSVRGDIVTLKVTEGDLKGRHIEAPVKTLRKLFRDGDHVKVIGGSKYIDEVGMVTRIKDDKVTLLCDSTQEEITVFSRDLKRAADSAQIGNDSHFQLYDMVHLDAATIGCVIKVDREILRVLDPQGSVRTIVESQITHDAQPNRHAVATDKDGSEIRVDDTIKEQGGEGRQGKVHYIHRGLIFAINRDINENAGMFVVRSQNVTTMAAKSGRAQVAGPDLSKMNPTMVQQTPNGNSMPPPRVMGRDKMIGKTVTIRRGPYKGLLGIVKETNGNDARVELHTKNRVVAIGKDYLTVKDPITGNTIEGGGKFPNRTRGGYPGATLSYGGGGRTPGWGNAGRGGQPSWATPGNRTPGWGSGSRTPGSGGGDGSRTSYGNDGSRTSYGGDGSRTSYGGGTSYGGATSYGGNDGSRTSYGGYNSGGRTPAPSWGSGQNSSKPTTSNAAPTPSAYTAPTPGAYQAPTPAAYGAYSAPTPGGPPMDAPTPGNFTASTPGDTAQHPTPRGYGAYGSGYGATPAAAPTPGAWAEAPTPWTGAPETPAAVEENEYV